MICEFNKKHVLVTGATGFIGRYLTRALIKQGCIATIFSRRPPENACKDCKTILGDLSDTTSLVGICQGIEIVFHLAGDPGAYEELDEKNKKYNWQVTVDGTRALVEQSVKSGVSRFVFFSSVKAMGENSDEYLDESAECRPVTEYGKAKYEAERLVLEANRHGMASTVLRLPMVYGPGCKGNLPRMIQAVAHGRFPSLPDTGNKRSMVDVRDVVQAAVLSATNPVGAGKVYIVTDGQAYSTRQIYEWICSTVQRPVSPVVIPLPLLRIAGFVGDTIGRLRGRRIAFNSEALNRIIGSSWYSSEKICRELNFHPAHSLESSLPDITASLIRI